MANNQLPADVQERVKADAAASSAKIYPDNSENDEYTEYELGYIAGATAEAERAQEVINAAEKVAKIFAHDDGNCAICELAKALQQWKGRKEVGNG